MWVSPNHPNPPQPREAPQDDGKPLGGFPRGDGREELRVSLKSYQGHPYLAVRVWERDQAGRFWPSKGRGCSIRLNEAEGVIKALRAGLASAGELAREPRAEAPREDRPGYVDRRRPQREDWRQARLPGPGQNGGTFDEFSEE